MNLGTKHSANKHSAIRQKRVGFSLVEIMVVVGLIGVIATIVIASMGESRKQAQAGKAQTELQNIKQAMQLYVDTVGYMPSTQSGGQADICTLCGLRNNNPTVAGQWESVVVPEIELRTGAELPVRDPWGSYYGYDNNYLVNVTTNPSIVCSRGPDKILQTWTPLADATTQREAEGDDICVFLYEGDDTDL